MTEMRREANLSCFDDRTPTHVRRHAAPRSTSLAPMSRPIATDGRETHYHYSEKLAVFNVKPETLNLDARRHTHAWTCGLTHQSTIYVRVQGRRHVPYCPHARPCASNGGEHRDQRVSLPLVPHPAARRACARRACARRQRAWRGDNAFHPRARLLQ